MADQVQDGWQVEQGIGEERALLYHRGQPVAAQMRWPGGLEPGMVAQGTLIAKPRGGSRGLARFAGGEEAVVDRLPRDASEGTPMRFFVKRTAVGEAMRMKPAQVRPTDEPERPAPSLVETLPGARSVRCFRHDDWEEIRDQAVQGIIDFTGGSLHFSVTPAMTVVDVDGHLERAELALASVAPLARGIRLFGLGGIVAVDFPTLDRKDDRRRVDAALADALADYPHERTAMNGFGLVQIVSRMERASMLHLLHTDPAGAAARLALRRGESLDGPGKVELRAHPAVLARMAPFWLDELRRRTGRRVTLVPDDALALEAPHAQLVVR